MMEKYLRGSSLLLYLLALMICFATGMILGAVSGAADGAGLAGGPIIIGCGLLGSFAGLVLAVMIVGRGSSTTVVRLNRILGWLFIIGGGLVLLLYLLDQ